MYGRHKQMWERSIKSPVGKRRVELSNRRLKSRRSIEIGGVHQLWRPVGRLSLGRRTSRDRLRTALVPLCRNQTLTPKITLQPKLSFLLSAPTFEHVCLVCFVFCPPPRTALPRWLVVRTAYARGMYVCQIYLDYGSASSGEIVASPCTL